MRPAILTALHVAGEKDGETQLTYIPFTTEDHNYIYITSTSGEVVSYDMKVIDGKAHIAYTEGAPGWYNTVYANGDENGEEWNEEQEVYSSEDELGDAEIDMKKREVDPEPEKLPVITQTEAQPNEIEKDIVAADATEPSGQVYEVQQIGRGFKAETESFDDPHPASEEQHVCTIIDKGPSF